MHVMSTPNDTVITQAITRDDLEKLCRAGKT
ncbi:MAG: hypothetical protein ACJARE_003914, partial [Paracoccaceae bacterium]